MYVRMYVCGCEAASRDRVFPHFSLQLSCSGAYGEVFKGTRKGDRADYAIKVMRKRKVDQQSILREVDVLNKLSEHSGVVKLKDSFQTQKEYVFVMEL